MKEAFKKCGYFLALFLTLVGAGCALGWTIYLKEWVAVAGVVLLIAMAVPTWIEHLKKLIS